MIKLPALFALALLVGCGGGGGGSISTSATGASVSTTTQASSDRQPKPQSTPTHTREAGAAERAQAAATVRAFLAAQAKRNWGAACSYLSASLRRGLEAASRRSNSPALAGKGCGGIMAGFLGKMPVMHRTAEVHPLSLRVTGAEAILVYRDGAGASNDIPLRREGGKWRVNFLTGLGGTR